MDTNSAIRKKEQFTDYLTRKGHRKTPERYAILDLICSINGHFDIEMLYQKMEEARFRVSRATLYNTIELLEDARLVVKHQFGSHGVQYECAERALTHSHLVCTNCGRVTEYSPQIETGHLIGKRIPKFTAEYCSLYIFGLCSKCKFALKQKQMMDK